MRITKIYRSDKDKDGNPLVSKKTGRPYKRISIKTDKYGEKWLSGFGDDMNETWEEGDEFDDSNYYIEENGQYLNIKRSSSGRSNNTLPTGNFVTKEEFDSALERIRLLEMSQFKSDTITVDLDEKEDLPF